MLNNWLLDGSAQTSLFFPPSFMVCLLSQLLSSTHMRASPWMYGRLMFCNSGLETRMPRIRPLMLLLQLAWRTNFPEMIGKDNCRDFYYEQGKVNILGTCHVQHTSALKKKDWYLKAVERLFRFMTCLFRARLNQNLSIRDWTKNA